MQGSGLEGGSGDRTRETSRAEGPGARAGGGGSSPVALGSTGEEVDAALLAEARRVLGGDDGEAIETALGESVRRWRRDAALGREVQRWRRGEYARLAVAAGPDPGLGPGLPAAHRPRGAPDGEDAGNAGGGRLVPDVDGWLLHPSALAVGEDPGVRRRLVALLGAGLLFTCVVTELALLAGAGSAARHRSVRDDRRDLYRWVPLEEGVPDLALAFQERVCEHRRADLDVSVLTVAACARLRGLTVLHHHPGFLLLAAACGVQQEPVLPLADNHPGGRA